jgi:hypothetical protein
VSFDANLYAALQQADPAQAAAYISQFANPQSPAPSPLPQVQQPQSQSQYAPNPSQQAQQPQPTLARGTLEDFYSQPSSGGGGKSATTYFKNKPQGSWLHFRVNRDITNADVQQMTDVNNVPQKWKYGPLADKPKFNLIVPGTVVASGDGQHVLTHPEGELRLWLKPGPVTDSFRAALAAAGEDSGFPKAGSEIVMISAGEKAGKQGYSPTKLYDFQYVAPSGETAANPTAAAPGVPTAPVAATAPPAPTAPANPIDFSQLPPTAPTLQAPIAPIPGATAVSPTPVTQAPVPNIAEDKAALLARLQGN